MLLKENLEHLKELEELKQSIDSYAHDMYGYIGACTKENNTSFRDEVLKKYFKYVVFVHIEKVTIDVRHYL